MAEKFCLKWNDFHSNVSKSFGLLRNEEYLYDVTLVGDDHKQISAHKLILSASSDYFKEIFKNNKHSHPLICLDGITNQDLGNVLDYIYNGEVQIYQDDLDRFLTVAQRLRLQGLLSNDSNDERKEETYTEENHKVKKEEISQPKVVHSEKDKDQERNQLKIIKILLLLFQLIRKNLKMLMRSLMNTLRNVKMEATDVNCVERLVD